MHWIQQLGAGNELHVCRTPEVGQEQLAEFCAANENQRTFCLLAGIDTSYGCAAVARLLTQRSVFRSN